MNAKEPLHDFVGMTTDISVLLREICIVAIFCLLFFAPVTFKSLLSRVGFTTLSTPLGDIDVDGAGGTVATLNRGLQDTIARLQQIQSTPHDPRTNSELQSIAGYLNSLQQEAQATDETIKTSLVSRQVNLEQSSPQAAKLPGWLLLGQVSDDKLQWSGIGAKNISATLPPKFTVGQKLNLTGTAYLRAVAPSGTHFGGKVIGVVPPNRQVQVIAGPDYSPAIAGGFFLWVQVQPL